MAPVGWREMTVTFDFSFDSLDRMRKIAEKQNDRKAILLEGLLHGNTRSYRLWYILSLALADLYQGEPVAKRVAVRLRYW